MNKKIKCSVIAVQLGVLIPSAGWAANYIWDGSTESGYQNTNGTWGVDNYWTLNGTTLSAFGTAADLAWFGGNATVAASPTGSFTVTVSGTQTAASIRQIQNGAGDYTLTGGTLNLGAAGVRADRGTFTVNSVITNSAGTLQLNVQSATGVIELGGNNTYTATTEIRGVSGGTVRLNNAGALGTGSALTFVNTGITLDLNGQDISGKNATVNNGQTGFIGNSGGSASTWSGNVSLATATANIRAGGTGAEVEIGGAISGDGTVQVLDGGTLRLSGANAHTGSTVVRDGGTLIVNHAAALGTTAGITYVQTGSKLNLNGYNIGTETIDLQKASAELLNNAGIAATANGAISLSAAGLIIGGSGDLNLGGIISGINGFAKIGDGTLTLSGINTYSGNTTVSFGQLTLADNAGLTFVIGANGVNNKIDGSAAVSLAGDFTFDLTSAGTTVGDAWTVVDVANLNETFASTFTVTGFTDAGGDLWTKDINGSDYYEFSEATGVLTVIPEPATIGVLAMGAVVIGFLRRCVTR